MKPLIAFSTAAATMVNATGWTGLALAQADSEPLSAAPPPRASLSRLEIVCTGLISQPDVTAYVSHDAAGAEPITPAEVSGATQTVSLSPGDATIGGVAWDLGDVAWARLGGLYVQIRLSAGTANAIPRLFWRE